MDRLRLAFIGCGAQASLLQANLRILEAMIESNAAGRPVAVPA